MLEKRYPFRALVQCQLIEEVSPLHTLLTVAFLFQVALFDKVISFLVSSLL